MDEAVAGSRLRAVRMIGTEQPAMAAITIEHTIEVPITNDSPEFRLHKKVNSAVTSATEAPLTNAAAASLRHTRHQ